MRSHDADILDTAGQEDYASLRDRFMRNAEGFLVVFSIINRASFEEVKTFHGQILRAKDAERVPMVLVRAMCGSIVEFSLSVSHARNVSQVGNKKDLEAQRQVSVAEAEDMAAKRMYCNYLETSAMVRVCSKNANSIVAR